MIKKSYVKSRKVAKIVFELSAPEMPEGITAQQVSLVGEFNNWDPDLTPMKYIKKRKVFQATLDLEPGRTYQFRYLVNGEHWCNDWEADGYVRGGHGEDNGLIVAPAS